jgi:hypothetical protein
MPNYRGVGGTASARYRTNQPECVSLILATESRVYAIDLSRVRDAKKYSPSLSSRRFRELQDEFFATSKRLQLAQKPGTKLALLNELQRIVQESKRALVDTDATKC